MEVKEVKKLKINAESIRSTLFESNKKLIKLRKDENSLLKKREDAEKKKKKEGFLESIKKGLPNLNKKKKDASKSTGGIMEFFSILGGALLIKTLPGLIQGAIRFLEWAKGIFESIQTFMENVGESIDRFVSIFESNPLNRDQLEADNEEISETLKEIEEGSKGLNEIASGLDKFKGDLEERTIDSQKQAEENQRISDQQNSGENPVQLSENTSNLVREEFGTDQIIPVENRTQIGSLPESSIREDTSETNNREEFDYGGRVGVEFERSPLASRGDAFNVFKNFQENLNIQSGLIDKQEESHTSLFSTIQRSVDMFGVLKDSQVNFNDMILFLLNAFQEPSQVSQSSFSFNQEIKAINPSSQLGQAASELKGLGTNREETNSGRDGCVWAVNQVYEKAGLTPPWGNSLWVPDAEKMMVKDGYTQVPYNERRSGDIMVMYDQQTPPQAHIGVVLPNGNVLSNSSSTASLSWEDTPEGYNQYYNGTGRIYRMPSSTGRKVDGNNVISNIPIAPMKYDLASIQNISTDQFEETNTIVLKVHEVVPVIVGG